MEERILLGHGSGGRMMHRLIRDVMAPAFSVSGFGDSAIIAAAGPGRLAFTTDGYVVSPIFFPGGTIGELAVNGTVNDLAVCGARPLALSAGFILEEGLPLADLRRIVAVDGRGRARRRGPDRRGRHQGGGARQMRRLLHHHGRHRRHPGGARALAPVDPGRGRRAGERPHRAATAWR